jgi:hypothetical protein
MAPLRYKRFLAVKGAFPDRQPLTAGSAEQRAAAADAQERERRS